MGDERADNKKRGFLIVTAAMLGIAAPGCVSDPPPNNPPQVYSSGGSTVMVQQPQYVQPAQPVYNNGVSVGVYNGGAVVRMGGSAVAVPMPGYGRMGGPPVAVPVQPVYRAPVYQGGGRMGGSRMGGGGYAAPSGGGRMYK